MSSLRAPVQEQPHRTTQQHVEQQDATDIHGKKHYFYVFFENKTKPKFTSLLTFIHKVNVVICFVAKRTTLIKGNTNFKEYYFKQEHSYRSAIFDFMLVYLYF